MTLVLDNAFPGLFGLSSAPGVFTNILTPLVAHIHLKGIHSIPYLDDCLIIAKSKKDLVMHVPEAVRLLQRAGFIINQKKSHFDPSQDLVFLGMRLRTDLGMVQLSPERVDVLIQCSTSLVCQRQALPAPSRPDGGLPAHGSAGPASAEACPNVLVTALEHSLPYSELLSLSDEATTALP